MAEQFSLCWDNFHSNLSTSFSELLKSEDLVDVTLAAEGRYLKAHKIVLSICSPYFQELFHVNPCQHPIVFLKDVSYSALSNLLQFMYQGEVKVSQDELTNFIKVAEALKIKGLTGDGLKENENETENHLQPSESLPDISLSKETTLTRKTPYGGQSPPRKKMMGPASKRPRTDLPEIPPHLIEDIRTVHPESDTVMNFKLEPEDLASAYDDGNEEFNYDDTNPDISNMSDSADYLMEAKMDTSMKEGKPGTSSNADPSGDNQGNEFLVPWSQQIDSQDLSVTNYYFKQNEKGSVTLFVDGYRFIKNRKRNNRIFWECSEYRNSACKVRMVTKYHVMTDCHEINRNRFVHNHPCYEHNAKKQIKDPLNWRSIYSE